MGMSLDTGGASTIKKKKQRRREDERANTAGMVRSCLLQRCFSPVLLRVCFLFFFFFSSRRRHTRFKCDWSSDVCSSDLGDTVGEMTTLVRFPRNCAQARLAASAAA